MGFRTYKTLGEVLKKYQIRYQQQPFVVPATDISVSGYFKDELDFTRCYIPYDNSDEATCENLVYPILREVWKSFIDTFSIWVEMPIEFDNEQVIVPDYVFTKQSVLGKVVFDYPAVVVARAKRGNIAPNWPQCLLEMHAIQQLNQQPTPVFGIVSNGDGWQIGQLENSTFTEYSNLFKVNNLGDLFSALTWVLES